MKGKEKREVIEMGEKEKRAEETNSTKQRET